MYIIKKMVIGDTYVYSGRNFSSDTIKLIRDGGIVELGNSYWEGNMQWIEVLENNLFIGFISSQTKLIDLNNYFYVMEDILFCYEKPDPNSEIKIKLSFHDKIYLVSKIFSKGKLWLKVYDKHGFCCYIDANSYIFPNNLKPYSTILRESTIMYVASSKKNMYKTIRLKKGNRIYVNRLVPYKLGKGLDISHDPSINDSYPIYVYSSKETSFISDSKDNDKTIENKFLEKMSKFDEVWMQIFALGQIGYIPAITKTDTVPYIAQLPEEHFIQNDDSQVYIYDNNLPISGLVALVLGLVIFLLVPSLSVFAFFFYTLGFCLFTLRYFCS